MATEIKYYNISYGVFFTLIIIIPVACDIEAIEPDTKKTIFFGILIINKGALSVAANINTPKMMACILGAMLKLLPEAA